MCVAKVAEQKLSGSSGNILEVSVHIAALEKENKRLKEENERLYKVIKMWERTCKLK